MGSYLSRFAALFKRKDPRTPVKNFGVRIQNMFSVHFRGLIGVLVPIAVLSWQPKKGEHFITVACLWFWMFWFFLLQPVNVPVVGFIPMFLLPMAGVMSTVAVCGCYFDDNVALFVLAGMNHLLLNSCGVDRRAILWFLCSGDSCQFSGKRIVLKASAAAFFMSIVSNRLIVTSTITQFLTPAYKTLQSSTARYRATEPNFDVMRHIVLCAVQTSSSIGSVVIMHASFATMAMRTIWCRHAGKDKEFPDIFNYLQYTCFAFPVAFLIFVLNFAYHMVLINRIVGKGMSAGTLTQMRNLLLQHRKALPPSMSNYQVANIVFYILFIAVTMFRWSDWLGKGWSDFRKIGSEVPVIKDATVAAMFVLILHILPKSFNFLKYITARTKRDLTLKPDSPVMMWRYVDKNSNYGYIILIGGAVALNTAISSSSLGEKMVDGIGKIITDLSANQSLLIVCIIAGVLPNVMSSVAACCIFLPFVLNMAAPAATAALQAAAAAPKPNFWSQNSYLGALGVGIASSFGYSLPFLYTPAFFCHFTGKVPTKEMIKYGLGSLIISIVILWLALCHFGPIIWVATKVGIKSYTVCTAAASGATTAAATTAAKPAVP